MSIHGIGVPAQEEPQTGPPPAPVDEGWPRHTIKDGTTLITYPPQVDDWKNFRYSTLSNQPLLVVW